MDNILLHFSEIRGNVCVDKNFDLNNYIKALDFEKHHKSLKVKIADLGFARKL
jgi:hypothetical protein